MSDCRSTRRIGTDEWDNGTGERTFIWRTPPQRLLTRALQTDAWRAMRHGVAEPGIPALPGKG